VLLAVGIEAAGVHRVVDPKVKNARFAAESGHLSSLGRQGSNVAVKRVPATRFGTAQMPLPNGHIPARPSLNEVD